MREYGFSLTRISQCLLMLRAILEHIPTFLTWQFQGFPGFAYFLG